MSFNPPKNKRVKGVSISIPIIYGNRAHPLKAPADASGDDASTHSWTIYLRPVDGKDLSWLISKVEFQLHESFKSPRRVRTDQPYEETEKGWGEFSIPIKLYFVSDSKEKPLTITHKLKLFEDEDNTTKRRSSGEVVSEIYDEIVLKNPAQKIYEAYRNRYNTTIDPMQPQMEWKNAGLAPENLVGTQFSAEIAETELSTINTALKKVQHQLAIYQARNKQTTTEWKRQKILAGLMPMERSALPTAILPLNSVAMGKQISSSRGPPPILPTPLNILSAAGFPAVSPLANSASSLASSGRVSSLSAISESAALSTHRGSVDSGIQPLPPVVPATKTAPQLATQKSPTKKSALQLASPRELQMTIKSPETTIETVAATNNNNAQTRKRRAK